MEDRQRRDDIHIIRVPKKEWSPVHLLVDISGATILSQFSLVLSTPYQYVGNLVLFQDRVFGIIDLSMLSVLLLLVINFRKN